MGEVNLISIIIYSLPFSQKTMSLIDSTLVQGLLYWIVWHFEKSQHENGK